MIEQYRMEDDSDIILLKTAGACSVIYKHGDGDYEHWLTVCATPNAFERLGRFFNDFSEHCFAFEFDHADEKTHARLLGKIADGGQVYWGRCEASEPCETHEYELPSEGGPCFWRVEDPQDKLTKGV